MDFPERLILLRQEKSLTQVDLANLVQISRSALSLYELGKREPDFSILLKLAQFFGVSTDYLLGRTDDPNPPASEEDDPAPNFVPTQRDRVIGIRIKEERNKKGLSQEELGKRFSLTQQAINKWESGKSSPDPEMIKNLADFFECSADYLVGRTQLPTTLAAHHTEPAPQELEEILRTSNVQFDGAPLDETDKEEVLEFLRYAWTKLRAKK